MYKLVLYVLFVLEIVALAFSAFGLLPFNPLALIYSTAVLLIVSWITNRIFALIFKTHANVESFAITAIILALIISPPQSQEYISILPFLIWAGIWSMAGKFILAISKKHIFNPAAFAVALTALTIGQSATWWIGTLYMLPFVLVGGLLIIRKIHRFDLVVSFIISAIAMILATSNLSLGIGISLQRISINTPLVFLALIMLTEPLTTPPTRVRRVIYGIFTGVLFAPSLHVATLYSTPELALIAGNILSFFLSPMRKYILTLKNSTEIAGGIFEFIFTGDHSIRFKPGQYMEWTLGHQKPDNRGNRRYFTIASSPTESDVQIGVRLFSRSSTFKNEMVRLKTSDTIMAHGVAGNFTLPRDKTKKLVFIAGGIGITPFRSMIKYLIDRGEKRDIIIIYSNNSLGDIAYTDVWTEAEAKFGIKTVYTLTDRANIPSTWTGRRGQIDVTMIAQVVADYRNRTFYISGPHGMVTGCRETLRKLGVASSHIVTDYFPGFV